MHRSYPGRGSLIFCPVASPVHGSRTSDLSGGFFTGAGAVTETVTGVEPVVVALVIACVESAGGFLGSSLVSVTVTSPVPAAVALAEVPCVPPDWAAD